MSKVKQAPLGKDEPPLPHPAEDLSADDDLLSWILVDQLGCMPNSRLGVHPQENKFVGPVFKTDEVLQIMRETVVQGNVQQGMARMLEFPLIKAHMETKRTESQRERFTARYLLCYVPTSRVDIHSTDRYTHITKHPELAVYATRPLPVGAVLQELQGSVVPLPEEWRAEMDLGDEFAREAAGEETDESDDGSEDDEEAEEQSVRRKGKEVEKGQRRSDRTRRRDFSIVWSGLKRCYQLFLGPARFLNWVYMMSVTDGSGDSYFGKDNIECLCLTCEQNNKGHFSLKPETSRSASETRSDVSGTPQKKANRPSNLRREYLDSNASEAGESETPEAGPSGTAEIDELETDDGSDSDSPEPIVREKLIRTAKTNARPFSFLKRPKSAPSVADSSVVEIEDDLPEDFPRCGSCAKPLHDRMWYAGRYFDHCARCTRHAFIYGLPWPAHRQSEVQEYPPSHLIPSGYIPRKISSIPLPSLQKKKFKEVTVEVTPGDPLPISRDYRRQLRLRQEIAMEDFIVQSLRDSAWALQEAHAEAKIAAAEAAEAKIEAKKRAREEKKRKDASKFKGSGLWNRYEYVTEAELRRRDEERSRPTSGTRRGRAFKVEDRSEEVAPRSRSRSKKGKRAPTEEDEVDEAIEAVEEIEEVEEVTESSPAPEPRAPVNGSDSRSAARPKAARKSGHKSPSDSPMRSPTSTRFYGNGIAPRPNGVHSSPSGSGSKAAGPSGTHHPATVDAQPTSEKPRKRVGASRPSASPVKASKKARHDAPAPARSPTKLQQRTSRAAEIPLPQTPSFSALPAHRMYAPSATPGTTPDSSAPIAKKRGRPKGSGKNQIAAAMADEQRRLSASSSAGPSASGPSTVSPANASGMVSRSTSFTGRGRRVSYVGMDVDDDADLQEGIEAELVRVKPAVVNGKSNGDKGKEKSGGSGSGDKKKVRSFFPSALPILKFGR